MIKAIDHIIILAPTPQETIEEIETTFGIKACVPLQDYGLFQSGIIRLGNLDIEVMGFGREKDFSPYFLGIALEAESSKWKTMSELNARNIKHTLPILIRLGLGKPVIGWDMIFLKGLLDNPIPAPYGKGFAVGNNWFGKAAAKLMLVVIGVFFILRKSEFNYGESSMLFFCNYYYDIYENYRNEATRQFQRLDGGKLKVGRVSNVVIEKTPDNKNWSALGLVGSHHSTQLSFVNGSANQIRALILTTTKKECECKFYIGDAYFELKYV